MSSGEGGEAGAAPVDAGELPRIDFSTFVLSLSHSALVHMGVAPDESGTVTAPSLELARQTIDLLVLLEEKTRGNLTGEEERIMSQVLYDLRLGFVEIGKAR